MTESLKSKTLSGVVWSLLERFGSSGIQFVVSVLIARLLSPKDYGVVGIVMIFITLSQVFINSGFGTALIQKKSPTQTDFASVFFFNLFVAVLLFVLLFVTAPAIESFFEFDGLTLYLRVSGIILILNALQLVQRTALQKQLRFRPIAFITVIAVIISGGVGFWMALTGFGVWSLIGQSLTNAFCLAVGFWVSRAWIPSFAFSISSLKSMFTFSSKILATALIDTGVRNLTSFVIGKFYSPVDLGFYYRGKRFQEFPSTSITQAIQSVTFPALSSIQHDDKRQKRAYKRIIRLTVFFVFPALFILAGSGENVVVFLLTEKWRPAALYLQVLALGGMLYPLHAITLNMCNVKGRSDIFLKLEIIKKTIFILFVLVAARYGVLALVIAESAVSFISYVLNAYYSGALIGYGLREQVKDVLPIYIIAAVSGGMCWISGQYVHGMLIFVLIVQIVVSAIVYLVLMALFHRSMYREIVEALKK